MNFKRITIFLTVLLGFVVIYSAYKVAIVDLFPWINLLITSTLSFIVFVLSFFVKGKNKIIQLALLFFFIIQLFLNYTIIHNSVVLIKNWRWLLYPISIFIYILSISVCFKKRNKLLLLTLVVISLFLFIFSIFSSSSIWIILQMLTYILFSITVLISKNIPKSNASGPI